MVTSSNIDTRVEELLEALRARDDFIATIGHELRNPMTPIAGRVSLLLRNIRSENYSKERIEAGLIRLEKQIELYIRRATTLLDVSRIRAGKLTLRKADADLVEVVNLIVEDLQPVADFARSPIETVMPATVPVKLDGLALEQIVENLVSNAIKYGAGNPVVLTVAAAGDQVIIRVSDQGIGISQADQQRIFERFERAVGREDHSGGFGVGLWLVCQLTEAMGGRVEVESTVGQGSVFTVTLPKEMKEEDA